jgi:hypothetical protein
MDLLTNTTLVGQAVHGMVLLWMWGTHRRWVLELLW